MAINGVSQTLIPMFKGECYEFWNIKMKTLFKSQDLWDLVEGGFNDDDADESRLRENRKKDSKALFILQQAVHETIFSRIATASTSKEAWETLQKEFQGYSKVIAVKLQTLRNEFEALLMKANEKLQDFLSRVISVVSQMRSYGENITDAIIVPKVLRRLTAKYDYIVTTIEEIKDLFIFSFDELMGSLQAHEAKRNRSVEKNEEKAFQASQVKGEIEKKENFAERIRGRGSFRGRGRGRGRGRSSGQERQFFGDQKWNKSTVQCYGQERQPFGDQKWNKSSVQCYECQKFGHIKANCPDGSQANYANEEKQESKLFMVHSHSNDLQNDVWFLDSGCPNHMTGNKSLFKELDESQKMQVRLGDNELIQVEGKVTIVVGASDVDGMWI
ncbi:uncharacterized protein [Primulina huaijiensis]|uniref:uncharacterized protein n=1 Tax=Primulina huaijiensis TaxID=1492673 RepID=UPI003CC6F765